MAYKNIEDKRAFEKKNRSIPANKIKVLARQKKWSDINRERIRLNGVKYREENKDIISLKSKNKYLVNKTSVFEILGNKCAYQNEYCNGPLEREHKHGVNYRSRERQLNDSQIFDKEVLSGNIGDKQLACAHHNKMKSNSTHEQFIKDCKAIYLAYERANPVPLELHEPSLSV